MKDQINTIANTNQRQDDCLPLVSVLMPAYNHEKWIEQAIRSIWSQTYKNIELIVVDDASPDNTYHIISRLSRESPIPMRVLRNVKNLGIGGALNRLIESANGEFLMLHADDDISYPHKIETLARVLLSDPSVSGVHSSLNKIDLDGHLTGTMPHEGIRREFSRNDIGFIIRNLHSLRIATQSHITRKTVFDFFGCFLKDSSHEAIVMLFREAFVGRIIYINEPLTEYRIGAGISTRRLGVDIDSLIKESIKTNDWHLTAANNIYMDIKRLKREMGAIEYLSYLTLIQWQRFTYWRREQVISNKSVFFSIFGVVLFDRVSASYSMKAFFPQLFMFLRNKLS